MLSVLMAAMLQAAPGPAPPPPATPALVNEPDWVRRPTGDDLARVYPREAIEKELAGRATLFCTITAAGDLADCEITEESPAGVGFGEATLKLAQFFKMRPMSKDGRPVAGGKIRVPIRYVLPGAASTDPLSAMLACYGATAAASEADPANEDLIRAYAFFAGQVAVQSGQARARPSSFEANLVSARRGAETPAARRAPGEPDLRLCLSVFRDNTPKSKDR
mgnify:CR=1 FL=1